MAFLSFPEMKELLESEFLRRFGIDISSLRKQGVVKDYGDLIYVSETSSLAHLTDEKFQQQVPYWCRSCMLNPFIVHFDSIGDGANALRAVQRSWAPYNFTSFRRASLLQDKLPHVNLKIREFPFDIPQSPIGLYTLLDNNTLIASAQTSSCLPAGSIEWKEDHENPPSRAYLKVQESLVLARHFFGVELPKPGDRCFEAGACPGGWTWVLTELGSQVLAVDRTELAESLMKNPLVEFRAHDAFTLMPDELGEFDWIFSDVICYPERLLGWIQTWLARGKCKNMICTIKMQGEIDWELIKQFSAIPDSRVVHLNYNKHELTFIHCGK